MVVPLRGCVITNSEFGFLAVAINGFFSMTLTANLYLQDLLFDV